MNGLLATTDFDWYRHLSSLPDVDEVNFWQPSSYRAIHSIQRGEPLLFKLKAPHNAICGFGLFAGGSELEASLAWDAFGEKNGVRSLEELIARVAKYREEPLQPGEDPKIGCQMAGQPVFFDRRDWIPQPADWSRNIVSGKTYDLAAGEGSRVWQACLARAGAIPIVAETVAGYGAPRLVEPRIGQGIFRVHVTEAWGRACAITGEHSLPVLEAAHIIPFEKSQNHRVSNGLLLRADIHKLFDKGYVTVTPDLVFRVSPRLRMDWKNGKAYYPLDGTNLAKRLPRSPAERPDASGLAWHNAHIFKPAAS